MDFFGILTMIGGLALFLYGMHLMGEGLTKASGGKLEKILENLTSNPIKAVLLGAGVTGVIQSSSATTVIVVGFVNSGIMNLKQAVGIIMGANIGTTVTSWILSMTGIESSNFFIQLLKPSSFSPVMALIGVVFLLFTKSDKKKDIGMILMGFAILMTGMDTMSAAVKPLADVPKFTSILTMFSNPVLGMMAGALLTAVIQSSSASVGILQALCATGAVGYSTALPIIMGQNIGTCVTAMISSIGASKNAKRAALIHLYFNVIGTVLFTVVFYALNAFLHFAFLSVPANAVGIAIIHSIFNVCATLVLLPFSKVLVKLATMTIHDDKTEVVFLEREKALRLLEPRFLETPAYATELCYETTVSMAKLSETSIIESLDILNQYDENKFVDIGKLEDEVDHYEGSLGNYLVQLSARSLSNKDSETLSVLLHCIGDLERISDHAVTLARAAKEMYEKKLEFSDRAKKELMDYGEATRRIVELTLQSFVDWNLDEAAKVEPMEREIKAMAAELRMHHIKRLRKGKCTIELGFIFSDITTSMESIADHCSNISQTVVTYEGNTSAS